MWRPILFTNGLLLQWSKSILVNRKITSKPLRVDSTEAMVRGRRPVFSFRNGEHYFYDRAQPSDRFLFTASGIGGDSRRTCGNDEVAGGWAGMRTRGGCWCCYYQAVLIGWWPVADYFLQYGLPGERAGYLLRWLHVHPSHDLQQLLRPVQLVRTRRRRRWRSPTGAD